MNRLVLVLIAFLIGCEWMDTVEQSYPDLDAAKKANAIGEGKWIPDFLPPSARNLREIHNLDTNESWLAFQIESSDLDPMTGSCKDAAQSDVVGPRKSPGRWWPQSLVQSSGDPEALKRFKFFQCVDSGEVAVDLEAKQVFYWDRGVRPAHKAAAWLMLSRSHLLQDGIEHLAARIATRLAQDDPSTG